MQAAASAPLGVASRFESVGVRLPGRRLSTRELLDSCRHRARFDLERLTGIRERRVCGEGEDSYTLAVDAAVDCLAHSRHGPQDIDAVISASITKWHGGLSYRFEPSLALAVKEAIGAPRALHFDVSSACAGMLTGVAILDAYIRSGRIRRGIVVSGEYISSLSDNARRSVRTIASRQLASLTLGDAGAAVMVERAPGGAPGIAAWEFATYGRHSDLCIGRPARGAAGAAMFTRPRKLHRLAIASCTPSIKGVLARAGVSIEEVDWVLPHQTSVRAIRAGTKQVSAELGGWARNTICNLEEMGNTASTTHFVALHRFLEERRIRAGERVLMLCYASGITIGALLFTMDELGERYGNAN
jgi:3-oxoacyl-[acyl-carrier-protein] synthase-3